MRGVFSRLLPSGVPNGEQKPVETKSSGRSSARGETGGAAIVDPGALHTSLDKVLFVLAFP
ncbi:MAG: hypothetical protein IPK78_17965 [Rhodospirillales bacterium]|nr:hypothetical protein [Rhodospirillales bacterium]